MASTYQTPGVYVEEIPKFPPSVAEVATAIPVFVGHTRKADKLEAGDLSKKPFRISSFLEYSIYYGDAIYQDITVTVDMNKLPVKASADNPSPYNMYYALRSFYDNGGGPCYVFSVGAYPDAGKTPDSKIYDDGDADAALTMIKKIDEITLLVFPDLAALGDSDKYYGIYKKALLQSGDLKDRFVILDAYPKYNGDDIKKGLDLGATADTLRSSIGTTELKFGAAYLPYLKTTFNYSYLNSNVLFSHKNSKGDSQQFDGLKYDDVLLMLKTAETSDVMAAAMVGVTKDNKADRVNLLSNTWTAFKVYVLDDATVTAIQNALDAVVNEITTTDTVKATTSKALSDELKKFLDAVNKDKIQKTAAFNAVKTGKTDDNLALLKTSAGTAFQATVENVIGKLYVEMPPSAAMAGLYAYVDRNRGVWKAPANVTVQSTIEPTFKVSDAEQATLNVSDTGKSINVIRSFTGRGVQVWGARTLDGNSNEWRYISVRRFFNMVEESVKKASEPFVFEPNDANTWIKVKAMIENFLILQWRAGALAGAKPEQAFYVAVGLNQTMTALDILEGRMIVEIGMAVVRPAEFIILRFSHKMQES